MLLNLVCLGFGVGEGGMIVDIYFYFVVGVLYLISLVFLGVGGIFYFFKGLVKLEEKFFFFGYSWDNLGKMIIILGIYLVLLGIGVFLFVVKVMVFGGLYDLGI